MFGFNFYADRDVGFSIETALDMFSGDAKMSKKEKAQVMLSIEEQMKEAAKNLDFERAMELRDILFELKSE